MPLRVRIMDCLALFRGGGESTQCLILNHDQWANKIWSQSFYCLRVLVQWKLTAAFPTISTVTAPQNYFARSLGLSVVMGRWLTSFSVFEFLHHSKWIISSPNRPVHFSRKLGKIIKFAITIDHQREKLTAILLCTPISHGVRNRIKCGFHVKQGERQG